MTPEETFKQNGLQLASQLVDVGRAMDRCWALPGGGKEVMAGLLDNAVNLMQGMQEVCLEYKQMLEQE